MALALAAWQFSAPLAAQDAGREAEALAAKAQQLQALGFRPQAIPPALYEQLKRLEQPN